MQPELKPVRTDDRGFGRGTAYEPAQDVAVSAQSQKVLRNTYMLLALTMVPTVIGAWIGMATSGVIMSSPIISTLVMLALVIGLQFGIAANRNSGIGVALLLLMTGLAGYFLLSRISGSRRDTIYAERNFFGVTRVRNSERPEGAPGERGTDPVGSLAGAETTGMIN